MPNNLRIYHKVFDRIRQWVPEERKTRRRNMALLIIGLFLSQGIHLSQIAST